MASRGTQTTFSDEADGPINDAYESAEYQDIELNDTNDAEGNPISNGKAGDLVSDVKQLVEDVVEEDDNPQCGWFGIRPRFIQFFNNPKGYLFFVCLFVLGQGMTVNGLIYVVTTTLERRFNLTSTRSGFISSCYDFSVMIIIIFVTYFGEKSHKPRWLGIGALIFASGCLLFTLPHFLTGYYQPRLRTDITTCDINGTSSGDCDGNGETGLSNYYWVFVAGQALHGIGASPLYTLNMAFLDENVGPTVLAVYIGVFQAMAILGPAVGYTVGGTFLSFYTDVRRDPAVLELDPESPLWVGAWWLGFYVPAGICVLVFIPLLGFPKALPGSKALERTRIESGHKGSNYTARSGFGNKLKDFPRAALNLLKNIPFMCVNAAACTESFILSSIAVFGPKYIESQFNVTAGTAALAAGILIIPSALIGCLGGGGVIRCFNLGFRGQMKLCIITMVIALLGFLAFLITCSDVAFAGVTVEYVDTNSTFTGGEANLTALCNGDCNCAESYDPVCGSDHVLYYSPCHAGCLDMTNVDDKKEYSDCKCVPSVGSEPSTVETGKCDYQCSGKYGFLVLTFIMLLGTFFAIVPSYTAVIRCVASSQRAFALGINSLMYRALGAVPGPVVYGALIDKSCLVWEKDCDGARSCWMYDSREMAKYFFLLCVGFKIGSIIFFTAALLFYKPMAEEGDDEEEEVKKDGIIGAMEVEEDDNAKVDIDATTKL